MKMDTIQTPENRPVQEIADNWHAVPDAPLCVSCERNPVRFGCYECGAMVCPSCAVQIRIPFRQQTLPMVADSYDKGYIWFKFYCPECHSKRRGWKH